MALIIKRKTDPKEVQQPEQASTAEVVELQQDTPDNHILKALECFAKGHRPGRTLMLIRNATGEPFEVTGYSLTQRRVSLMTGEGVSLNPLVGDREARLYRPFWR